MTAPPAEKSARSVGDRWTPALAKRWTPVSSFFLENYHRLPLPKGGGLTSSEAMLLIHLIDYKWTDEAPWPSVAALAKRMDITRRAVRLSLAKLEEKGLLRRVAAPGRNRSNRYVLDGLFAQLEALLAQDNALRARPGGGV
jgi:DNA-binding MarR family transcriptional regulator